MINAEVPKELTFDLPEGQFNAAVTMVKPFVKQARNKSQDWVRFLFEVEVPNMSNFECMSGRNFHINLKAGSDLRNWLTELLGEELFRAKSGSKIDLESLVGTKCGVVLEHLYGKGGHDKPLVIVARVLPRSLEGGGKY